MIRLVSYLDSPENGGCFLHALEGRPFEAWAAFNPRRRKREWLTHELRAGYYPAYWFLEAGGHWLEVKDEETVIRILTWLTVLTPEALWAALEDDEANWFTEQFYERIARCRPHHGSCALPSGHRGQHNANTTEFFPARARRVAA